MLTTTTTTTTMFEVVVVAFKATQRGTSNKNFTNNR